MKVLSMLLSSALMATITVDLVQGKRYEELGGRHQGDIVLTDIQQDAASGGQIPIVQDASKWVKGIVPFELDPAFNKPQVEQIYQAMGEVSGRSCVRFVTRDLTHRQFLNITAMPNGCWATLGMNQLSNRLNLHPEGCMRTGQIVHQLLHVLGLTHPQSRPDRDFYVRVQEDAVDPSRPNDLKKYQPGAIEDFGIPYDYESILHCEPSAFGVGTATVVPKDAAVGIGQREALSLKDVRKLNMMYDYDFCGFCLRGVCSDFRRA